MAISHSWSRVGRINLTKGDPKKSVPHGQFPPVVQTQFRLGATRQDATHPQACIPSPRVDESLSCDGITAFFVGVRQRRAVGISEAVASLRASASRSR
ncbi:hypothetical protein [Nostoc sp. CALU 1950]|uniref:hypothetical protein n=1 Tax=Nostoc sp. CALU 1950 TaxID=3104321 RepID=UPI003EC081EE